MRYLMILMLMTCPALGAMEPSAPPAAPEAPLVAARMVGLATPQQLRAQTTDGEYNYLIELAQLALSAAYPDSHSQSSAKPNNRIKDALQQYQSEIITNYLQELVSDAQHAQFNPCHKAYEKPAAFANFYITRLLARIQQPGFDVGQLTGPNHMTLQALNTAFEQDVAGTAKQYLNMVAELNAAQHDPTELQLLIERHRTATRPGLQELYDAQAAYHNELKQCTSIIAAVPQRTVATIVAPSSWTDTLRNVVAKLSRATGGPNLG